MSNNLTHLDLLNLVPDVRYPVTLPVSGKTIEIEPYRHGNVKSLLLLTEDFKTRKKGHMKKSLQAMKDIVQKCILPDPTGEKINVNDLHIADFVYVMNYMKSISDGETSKFYFKCKNCETPREFIFHLDDCEKKNIDKKDIDRVEINFDENNKVILHVKPFNFDIYYKNAKYFGREFTEGNEATNYYASFIEEIESSDGRITNNLKKDVAAAFLDKLFEKDIKNLVEYINNSPGLIWKKKFECEKCGVINTAILEDPTDFFV